ncbi:MAG: transposase [Methylotetracoccus sp.]
MVTLTFYRLPRQHHKHMKSTNMLERLNEEIKRRTWVVRIFPNTESCLRLVRALCVETHEAWLEDNRYLNMSLLVEQKKELTAIGGLTRQSTHLTHDHLFAQLDAHNPADELSRLGVRPLERSSVE